VVFTGMVEDVLRDGERRAVNPGWDYAFGDSTAFMRSYGHGELTRTEQARRRLYCLHLVLIMVIETVYRGHPEPRQYNWARERLTEVMVLFGRRPR
jgi:hypothetical protein